MKQIYVIRHADKDRETGELTDIGRDRARKLKELLGLFDFVFTSNKNTRLLETAQLLTGVEPAIDTRAGLTYFSEEQHKKIGELAKNHPMTHAGVLFDNPEYENLADKIGNDFITFLKELFYTLPKNGKALVVTQDAVMVAGEKKLLNIPYQKLEKNYQPLEGFIVNEDLSVGKLEHEV